MELYAEMKLAGDGYAGGFSCGLTMTQSQTMEGFSKSAETPEEIRYQNTKNVTLTVHKKKDGAALRTWTEVSNGSSEAITLEMLASFALKDVAADKIHLIITFRQSAEFSCPIASSVV